MRYRSLKQLRWAHTATGRKALGPAALKRSDRYIKGRRAKRLPMRVKKR